MPSPRCADTNIEGDSRLDIAELLMLTVEKKGSDLHLNVGSPPCVRIHGEMERQDYPSLTRDDVHSMLYDIMTDQQKSRFEEHHDLDFSVELNGVGRFRVNVMMTRQGEGAVLRVIPTKIKSVEELGLPAACRRLTHYERGLVLVTGPTGSGKSTTLAAMIDLINESRKGHILTIEDPIEFVHPHKNCLVTQREIGPHTESFATALRAALREDPDVILVGEMRDYETISLAVTAAETGHLVFGTLHTSSAPQTIDRIIDVFPEAQQNQIRAQLAEAIQGVLSQALLRTADGAGRVCAVEVMVGVSAIRNLIREGKTFQIPSVLQTGQSEGMQTMDSALIELVKSGRVRRDDAFPLVTDKDTFNKQVGAGPSIGMGAPSLGLMMPPRR
jgi:twitching motility protein PilT